MSSDAYQKTGSHDRAETYAVAALIFILGLVWLGLIWTGTVDLKNGDYSARIVLVQHVSLNPASAIWNVAHFIWPPLPFWIHSLLWNVCAAANLDNDTFVKSILSLSALLSMIALYLVYRIARHFAPAPAGLLAVLIFASLSFLHAMATSALSQAIATPLLLLATLIYIRRIDTEGSILAPALLFLVVSLARTDSVFYSSALSMILFVQRQWLRFFIFNFCSSIFFLIHQSTLLFNGSFNYFAPSHYYDFTQETFQTQFHFLLIQSCDFLGMESATQAGLVMGLLTAGALAVSLAIACMPQYRDHKSRFVFALFLLALLFLFLSPFVAGNVRGRHARDAIYAAAVLSAAFGIGLSGTLSLLLVNTRATRVATAVLAAILIGGTARAVVASTGYRPVPDATQEVRAWLEQNMNPGDGVVFEGPWSEYLNAHLTHPQHSGLHWSFAVSFFTFETKRDPIVEEFSLTEVGWRRLCSLSAARKVASGDMRYLVAPSTGPSEPDAWGAVREGFLFPYLEGEGDQRDLKLPPVLSHSVRLDRRFHSSKYTIWEIAGRNATVERP
jgi:hypothetical protein